MRGNRRSVNNPEGEGSAAGDSTARIAPAEPQISNKGLQFSGFTPIQPLPSIKETTTQTLHILQQTQEAAAAATPAVPAATTETPPPEPVQPQDGDSAAQTDTETASTPVTTADTAAPTPPEETEETATESFEDCWHNMVDAIFLKKPAFYHQMRDYLPRFENEIIYIEVENDFQKNQLEMSKRAMLEYWREHFRLNVNEMEFVIHEHEKKKVIYTSEDKVNNMLEQNPELRNFLQVLNFRIKD